jgi:hypothetical protein
VVSWAATRAFSINTLLDYALDRILPEFGRDPDVAPLGEAHHLNPNSNPSPSPSHPSPNPDVVPSGEAQTAGILLDGAHRMAQVGWDYVC